MPLSAAQVWRDFVMDGIASSGVHKPVKAEIRAWGTALEEASGTVVTVEQIVTAAGTTVIGPATNVLIFNKATASPSPCNLPDGNLRDGVILKIYDFKGNAGDITLTPFPGQQIMGGTAPWPITSGGLAQTGGSATFTYRSSIPGWVVG